MILTTHYMEEAQELCDRVAILDEGRIMDLDTPQRLMERAGIGYRVEFECDGIPDPVREELGSLGRLEQEESGLLRISCGELPPVLYLLARLGQEGLAVRGLTVRSPTLEDVFLTLTGHALRD